MTERCRPALVVLGSATLVHFRTTRGVALLLNPERKHYLVFFKRRKRGPSVVERLRAYEEAAAKAAAHRMKRRKLADKELPWEFRRRAAAARP